jgi:hypothetical protein
MMRLTDWLNKRASGDYLFAEGIISNVPLSILVAERYLFKKSSPRFVILEERGRTGTALYSIDGNLYNIGEVYISCDYRNELSAFGSMVIILDLRKRVLYKQYLPDCTDIKEWKKRAIEDSRWAAQYFPVYQY